MWRSIVIGATLITQMSWSANLDRLQSRLQRVVENLNQDIDQIQYGHSKRLNKKEALLKVERIKNIIGLMEVELQPRRKKKFGNRPGHNVGIGVGTGGGIIIGGPVYQPGPGAGHGNGYQLMSATCHIDNDQFFDWNEHTIQIAGNTVDDLLSQCQSLSQGSFQSSYGINNVQINGHLPPQLQTAECHIDNDQFFDQNEYVIGTVAGASVSEMMSSCEKIAQAIYKYGSSSGITNLNRGKQIPFGMMSATCLVDNSQFFNNGDSVGTVLGHNIHELNSQCHSIAQDQYGQFASSRLANVNY